MRTRVIVILILVLIALAIVLWTFFQSLTTPPVQTTPQVATTTAPVAPAVSPTQVVSSFYQWYLADNNALPNTGYKTRPELTDGFKTRVSELLQTGTSTMKQDPFVCSSEKPTQVKVVTSQVLEQTANVSVESDTATQKNSFLVQLVVNNNTWLIDDVQCFAKG